jgi:hypothetical protein
MRFTKTCAEVKADTWMLSYLTSTIDEDEW